MLPQVDFIAYNKRLSDTTDDSNTDIKFNCLLNRKVLVSNSAEKKMKGLELYLYSTAWVIWT
jgi:hypothetical protein